MVYYYAHREEQLARVKKYNKENREKINQREREKTKIRLKWICPFGVDICVYQNSKMSPTERELLSDTIKRRLPKSIVIVDNHKIEIYFNRYSKEDIGKTLMESLQDLGLKK